MRLIFITLYIMLSLSVQAQSVENIVANTVQDKVIINYDLNGTTGANYYVNIYYSIDGGMNYIGPLRHVSGEVASGVQSGAGKKAQWDIFKELNYQNEPIQFKVEAIPNLRKAKAISGAFGDLSIIKASYVNNILVIEFSLLPSLENETMTISMAPSPYLTTQSGEQLLPEFISFGLGEFYESSKYVAKVPLMNGIDVKGLIKFKMTDQESVIPALLISFKKNWDNPVDYKVVNIPIER
ncbi:hypothetical protein GCM10027429_19930 [Marivirga atlantica]|jgi:hypothetical protein|uniref:Uncharacterized protein n=1 Tax=Marivirga atlantica TaxID=1548457 RepID=A0A937AB18_9BACT|nr:hypothetical protein [Marivirga atlantica]MBL0765611.1 hypothetical protein [Marivirga atlantica]